MAASLSLWLGSRTPEQLAGILANRPEATAAPAPAPRHLRELAERLETFAPVAQAVHRLPAPGLQVIEVLQLLGPRTGSRTALAGWLGCGTDDPGLAGTLELLAGHALVWPDGDQLHMARPLYQTFHHPLRLGPPAAALLSGLSSEQLHAIVGNLGLPPPEPEQAAVAAIAAVLADGDRVRELVAGASTRARAALEQVAAEAPTGDGYEAWYGYYAYQADPSLRWALERGLVVTRHPGPPQVPREVALALRGPDWRAPFTPHPPAPALAQVEPAAVAREAAAAGTAAVEQLTALLDLATATPVALLKAGGVGVKELRRVAKALGTDEEAVRLWLELAYQAGLVAPASADGSRPTRRRPGATPPGVMLPTPRYDEWAAAEPADRLAALLPYWADLPAAPLAGVLSGAERQPAALIRDEVGPLAAVARQQVLGLAATLPDGHGIADDSRLPDAVCWRSPLVIAPSPDGHQLVAAAWREAQLVGAVAHGVLTPLGHALRAGSEAALAAACQRLLPTAVHEAIFQADLTALVPGTPAGPLAELLDTAADREAAGGAMTWRFSAASVRRALDGGQHAEGLLAALHQRAAGGTLPQPLEYLVADVARRHGAVRVRPVACVLHAENPALLAEIASARTLRSLELSVVAPTVLGSAKPVDETLAALREAGYAPMAESAEGELQLERVERRRAPSRRRRPGRTAGPDRTTPEPVDPMVVARRLLAAS